MDYACIARSRERLQDGLWTHSSLGSLRVTARGAVRSLLLALALGAAGPFALGQVQHGVAESTIKGFAITGDNPLSAAETAALLAPFLHRESSHAMLRQAGAALEQALHERGHGLYRVVLPPQVLSDTITLKVLRQTIDRVQVDGQGRYFDPANVRAALPELQEQTSPNLRRLARETAVANENPSRHLQVALTPGAQPDTVSATVQVRERRPWRVGLAWNNQGTPETGRDRLTLAAGHDNLFGRDHGLDWVHTTSPDHSSDVRQYGVRYRVPLYAWGGVAVVEHQRSDVVGSFGLEPAGQAHPTFQAMGAGHETGLGYTHHLAGAVHRRAQVSVTVRDRLFQSGEVPGSTLQAQDRRTRALSADYAAQTQGGAWSWGYQFGVTINLPHGRANELAAYQSEAPAIETTRWKAWRGAAHAVASFGPGWQLAGRLQAQVSSDLLLAGEAFALGGIGSVRGVPERALYGDSGLAATLEASPPPLWQGLRALAFIDAGWVRSDVTDSPLRRREDRLASVGLGLRYAHASGASLRADYARVIAGSRADHNLLPASPIPGDDKLHVNVSLVF